MSVVAVEAAIVDRLRSKIQNDLQLVEVVYGHKDYASVPEINMVTPSLAVIYNGYTPGSSADKAGMIQSIALQWIVVINVSNAMQSDLGAGVRQDVSPIFDATLAALLGWRTIPKFQPLKLEPAPGAVQQDSGFGYFPLAFSTTATYRGHP